MKKNIFHIGALLLALLLINQSYAQDRSPAGERSGREGGAGDRGGSDGGKEKQAAAPKKDPGRATYEKERSDATSGEADYNRGMNNDNIGGTPAGSRDAGTMSGRAGADVKESERDAAGPDNSDRGMNHEGIDPPNDHGIKKSVLQIGNSNDIKQTPQLNAEPVPVITEAPKPQVVAPKPPVQAPKKPKPVEREHNRADRF